MMLSDIRDYIDSLAIGNTVYMGQMDAKAKKSIGVYNSKHQHEYRTAIGGDALKSYESKYISLLIHWNESLRDTEKAAVTLMSALVNTYEATVNDEVIQFILPLYDIQDVGPDDSGVREMVLEVVVISKKGGR